jgi:thymidylate kinase
VGADGSGKTTQAALLAAWLGDSGFRVRICYLGIGTGRLRKRLQRFRQTSKAVEKQFNAADKTVGPILALFLYAASRLRRAHFRRAWRYRKAGWIVVTDRYPQDSFPGLLDGPLLGALRPRGRIAAWLATREAHLFREMAAKSPDLAVKMTTDVETALMRKPEHKRERVERKIEAVEKLGFAGAKTTVIDATEPLDVVAACLRNAVAAFLEIEERP